MPSPESAYLADLYRDVAARLAAVPNLDLQSQRDIFDSIQKAAIEPTEVNYEEVAQAGTCHALWHKPLKASCDHVILYCHGGGYTFNNDESHRKMVGHLAKRAGMPALTVDYRLVPDYRFPAQIEDMVAAYRWLVQEQGYKPQNIAIAGDSAGGGLSYSLVLKLRDLGEPLPAAIVAFSPWVDMEMNGETLKTNAGTDAFVKPELLAALIDSFLGPNVSRKDPLANPLYADFKGLPPMYVTVGTWEVLEDNGERLVERAHQAGVEATLEKGEEMQHVYEFMAGRAKEADDSLERAAEFLKKKLHVEGH